MLDVASSGWVKETINGTTMIRIDDQIRSLITDDIDDGFYGYTEYNGAVHEVRYYAATNERMLVTNKTAFDAILSGHALDADEDGYADTADAAPTDPSVH